MSTRTRERSVQAGELAAVRPAAQLAEYISGLKNGAQLPSQPEMRRQFGLTQREVKSVTDAAFAAELVVKGRCSRFVRTEKSAPVGWEPAPRTETECRVRWSSNGHGHKTRYFTRYGAATRFYARKMAWYRAKRAANARVQIHQREVLVVTPWHEIDDFALRDAQTRFALGKSRQPKKRERRNIAATALMDRQLAKMSAEQRASGAPLYECTVDGVEDHVGGGQLVRYTCPKLDGTVIESFLTDRNAERWSDMHGGSVEADVLVGESFSLPLVLREEDGYRWAEVAGIS